MDRLFCSNRDVGLHLDLIFDSKSRLITPDDGFAPSCDRSVHHTIITRITPWIMPMTHYNALCPVTFLANVLGSQVEMQFQTSSSWGHRRWWHPRQCGTAYSGLDSASASRDRERGGGSRLGERREVSQRLFVWNQEDVMNKIRFCKVHMERRSHTEVFPRSQIDWSL